MLREAKPLAGLRINVMEVRSSEVWIDLQQNGIDLFAAEENATFWLWAYPSLLGWKRRFEWLFSPVIGNTEYPGDLWGVDDTGNLLLVETKLGKGSDPFVDFIGYERTNGWEAFATRERLIQKWERLYQSEQSFWLSHESDLRNQCLGEITARGIVPYSSKRWATIKWSTLYTKVLVHRLFEGKDYSQNVRRFLGAVSQPTKNSIYYFGLIFAKDVLSSNLSAKGDTHFHELMNLADTSRVALMIMTVEDLPLERLVYIQCSRPTPAPPDRPLSCR